MRSKRLAIAVGSLVVGGTLFSIFHDNEDADLMKKESQLKVVNSALKNSESKRSSIQQRTMEALPDPSTFQLVVGTEDASRAPASGAANEPRTCSAIEYAGSGPDELKVHPLVWDKFLADYMDAKEQLISWLKSNADSFPKTQLAKMEVEIRETRVMRPQVAVEPDLTWRGIAAWTHPKTGSVIEGERPAVIHVSDGFLKLYQKNRERARFEMTRVLAQAWAPCEMGAGHHWGAWNGLMECLGFSAQQMKCSPGVVSEGTWAASTAVATLVAPPGCEVPAFQGEKYHACLGGFKRSETASYPVEVSHPQRELASKAQETTK